MLGGDEVSGHDRGLRGLARLSQGLPDLPQQDLLVLEGHDTPIDLIPG
jgi:hypothetical protein